MKIKQLIILSAAFVLPISIFIFLKTMGKNEFAVEPFYQQGVLSVSTECGPQYQTPYHVQQAVLTDLGWREEDSLTLYIFKAEQLMTGEISRRMEDKLAHAELKAFVIAEDSVELKKQQDLPALLKDVVSIDQLKECFFLMEKGKNAVLLDKQRRIRGYYNLADREEIDRLAVELTIILKKY
jgi:hypothetical protein